eukprot:4895539-Amphidinium_carterae.1
MRFDLSFVVVRFSSLSAVRIKQMAQAQVARVQENALKLDINICIEAPKLTVHGEKEHMVEAELKRARQRSADPQQHVLAL